MSPLVETRIIFLRELRKNFRSAKGIALAVLTLLGGAAMALVWSKVAEAIGEREGRSPIDSAALAFVYGEETGKWLQDAPFVLFTLLMATMTFSPLLVALMGFDAISGDIQHRTVRYWTLRSRRASYFVGKWAGLWATVAIVTLVMDVIIWVVNIRGTMAHDASAVSHTLSWGLRFWVITTALAAVWSGIAVLVSALFRTPIVALLVTVATFFTLWVSSLVFGYFHMDALVYIHPNHFDRLMLVPHVPQFLGGIAAALAMAAAYVVAGSLALSQRDV